MENIAPDIFRQRLLVEGFYTIHVEADVVKTFLLVLTNALDLRPYVFEILSVDHMAIDWN